jgi:hypothetical protein
MTPGPAPFLNENMSHSLVRQRCILDKFVCVLRVLTFAKEVAAQEKFNFTRGESGIIQGTPKPAIMLARTGLATINRGVTAPLHNIESQGMAGSRLISLSLLFSKLRLGGRTLFKLGQNPVNALVPAIVAPDIAEYYDGPKCGYMHA